MSQKYTSSITGIYRTTGSYQSLGLIVLLIDFSNCQTTVYVIKPCEDEVFNLFLHFSGTTREDARPHDGARLVEIGDERKREGLCTQKREGTS